MATQADSLGPEALFQASSEGKLRLVRLLVDGGTVINVRNENQETPLILACKSESEDKEKVVEFLIKHRVKMNLQDVEGKTALMYACLANASDYLIRMLVYAKANPWIKDESKNTAFDYAINAGNTGTVKLMIQACREGKMLTKPGSFNMEMKRLEDRLDQMPEMRKCSWPLMGPRSNSTAKEKKNSHQSELLAVCEDDENGSPTRERRRKKSICHFDPIEIEPDKSEATGDNADHLSKPLRKCSLYSVGRSSSEDERISLHFSDSDNSSLDRSSATFSSLERLLKIRDSISSSVDSNDSVHSRVSPVLQVGASWNPENDKHESSSQNTCTKDISSQKQKQENNRPKLEYNNDVEANKEDNDKSKGHTRLFPERIRKKSATKADERTDETIEPSSRRDFGNKTPSPLVSRRTTVGSFVSRKDDVMEGDDSKRPGNEGSKGRRVTVSTMEGVSRTPQYSTSDVLGTKSSSQTIENNSSEIKLTRKKMRQPEVDLPLKRTVHSEKDSALQLENKNIHNTPDTTRTNHFEASKTDFLRHINLPIISKPDEIQIQDEKGGKLVKATPVEKVAIRRTLSDSICQGSRRANVVTNRSDNRLSVSRNDFLLDAELAHTDYRERSASSPLTLSVTNTPCCDVILTTTSGFDAAWGRGARYRPCGDLPDLVLQSPARSCSLSNNELHATDQMQRLSRSSTPEVLSPVSPGSQGYLSESYSYFPSKSTSGSYTHLPEVVSGTTSNPKEKGTTFLPPLNISRKSNDAEEGYFSCSPSPMDLESPNRGKEKSRYSFKPLSPRFTNRPVRNLFP